MGPPTLAVRHAQAPLVPPPYTFKDVPRCECRVTSLIGGKPAAAGGPVAYLGPNSIVYALHEDSSDMVVAPAVVAAPPPAAIGDVSFPAPALPPPPPPPPPPRPSARDALLGSMAEMLMLCNEAIRRRPKCPSAAPTRRLSAKPLGLEYMADRLDIDDPLLGYAVRSTRGELQGFVTATTFTNWQKTFRWDSTHEAATAHDVDEVERAYDHDGSLGRDLEKCIRLGDPWNEGIVWPRVAEISLLGALGCGRLLVSLIVERLRTMAATGKYNYDYVVLQATDNSIPFYESMGFVRVGAIVEDPAPGKDAPPKGVAGAPPAPCFVSSPVEQYWVKKQGGEVVRDISIKNRADPWDVVFLNKDLHPDIAVGSRMPKNTMVYLPITKKKQDAARKKAAGPRAKDTEIRWYDAEENETPRSIGQRMRIDAAEIVRGNTARHPQLRESSRLRKGTRLKIAGFDVAEENFIAYSHWLFPDDSAESSEPSYMMARRLDRGGTDSKEMPVHRALAGRILSDLSSFPVPQKIESPPPPAPSSPAPPVPAQMPGMSTPDNNAPILPPAKPTPAKSKKTPSKTKKRKRHPEEPPMPKKPMAPFFFFCDAMRQGRKEELAGKSITEQTKVISTWWRAVPDSGKVPYEEAYRTGRVRYEGEMVGYTAAMAVFRAKFPEWGKEEMSMSAAGGAGTAGAAPKASKGEKKFKNLFNKVVRLNAAGIREAGTEYQYFYVLTYLPDLQWVHLGPLTKKGVFGDEKPNVQGRTKWILVPEEENKEVDITASVCEIVRARAMKRTADADDEEWDVADEKPSASQRRRAAAASPGGAVAMAPVPLPQPAATFPGLAARGNGQPYRPVAAASAGGVAAPRTETGGPSVPFETVFRAVPHVTEGPGWREGFISILDV